MKMMALIMAWAGLVLGSFPAITCEALIVEDAWVRLPPPSTTTSAAYFSALNDGADPVTISGVSSPMFNAGAIHETRYVDGSARMVHHDSITLPPGERISAAPGGLHVMLFKPTTQLVEGATVALEFRCESGTRHVEAPLLRRAPITAGADPR